MLGELKASVNIPGRFFLVHSKRPDYNLVFTQSAFFFWKRKGFVILRGTSQSFYGKRLFPSLLLTNPITFDLIRASLCLSFQPHVAMSNSPVQQIKHLLRCLFTYLSKIDALIMLHMEQISLY